MSRRSRSAEQKPVVTSTGDRLRSVWLGALTALLVATPILPTETVLFGGSIFILMVLWWMLLLGWFLSGALRAKLELKLDPAIWAWLAFAGWHSISALVMAWNGQPRASLNMLWLWLTLGVSFFLVRQLVITAAERRAMVIVMIALAVSLSAVGFYQYFYELPLTRAKYREDPERVMRDAGIYAPAGSPQRKMFEDRLYSTEPIATFALTNSLAGFLAPWLIVVFGVALTNWNSPQDSTLSRIGGTAATLLILGCCVLTKSRTGWLAISGGVLLLLIYGRRAGWRPDWRILAGIGGAAVVLPFLGVVIGGLDRLVVLESSKSFLFRLQYWQSTAELIGDYPWFGCGPGNFQQYYTAYKLPEASETIAEPHNFLLEIWATAGTPAIALFLAIFGGLIWHVWRAELATKSNSHAEPNGEPKTTSIRAIYWGSLLGGILGYALCGFVEGYFPSPALLLPGFLLAAGVIAVFHGWIQDGHLSTAVLSIAMVTMLVNFLAAGGISFAGVAQSLWLLAALVLSHAEASARGLDQLRGRQIGRWQGLGITAAIGLLVICYHQTAYAPVTESQMQLMEGSTRRMLGQLPPTLTAFELAAQADPWSPDPWDQLAETTNEWWLKTGDHSLEDRFQEASRENLARNKRSSHSYMQTGHRWLAAYRRFDNQAHLEQAIQHYRIAVKLYPNYNFGHAQLAWALHLAGDPTAEIEAEEAIRLDLINPHQEQKLSEQRLFDAVPTDSEQPPQPGLSAEQMLLKIRNQARNTTIH